MYIYMYIYIYVCIYTYIYIYMVIYIYTYEAQENIQNYMFIMVLRRGCSLILQGLDPHVLAHLLISASLAL